MNRCNYYVYYLIDPRNSQPFYIGKGRGNRYKHHFTDARKSPEKQSNPNKCATINSIISAGLVVEVAFVRSGATEQEALVFEQQMIAVYGRGVNGSGILTNLQSGEIYTATKRVRVGYPVCQYSMSGELIRVHPSFTQAAYDTNIPISRIWACSMDSHNHYTAGGFQWRLFGDDSPNEFHRQPHPNQINQVVQYDLKGNFIAIHISGRDAAKSTNVPESNISKCIHGHANRAGDFQWKEYTDHYQSPIPQYARRSARKKRVMQQRNGHTVGIFDGILEAANETGIHPSSIRQVCMDDGRFNSVKGFTFKYI